MRWLASLLLTCACVSTAVAQKLRMVEYGKSADFSSYKTYTWLPVKTLEPSGIVENNPNFAPVVKEAIDKELTAKGMRVVPTGGDIELNVFGFRYSSPQLEAIAFAGPADAEWAVGGPMTTLGRYNQEGTLAVNMIDTKSNKSAWAAVATASIGKESKTPGLVRKAVSKMFEHYPPKPKK